MFDGVIGFFKVVPAGFYIALLCMLLITVAIWIFYKRRKNKKLQQPEKKEELINIEEESIGMRVDATASAEEPAIMDSAPPLMEINTAIGDEVKIDKTAPQTETGLRIKVGLKEKYRAVIKWYPKPGRTPIIEFDNKIDRPVGGLYFLEPSCPVSGDAYFIKQNADGTFSPYEPRGGAILSDKTPYMAYEATHWEEAEGVWITKEKSWFGGKVGTLLTFGICAMCLIVVLVKIGS